MTTEQTAEVVTKVEVDTRREGIHRVEIVTDDDHYVVVTVKDGEHGRYIDVVRWRGTPSDPVDMQDYVIFEGERPPFVVIAAGDAEVAFDSARRRAGAV